MPQDSAKGRSEPVWIGADPIGGKFMIKRATLFAAAALAAIAVTAPASSVASWDHAGVPLVKPVNVGFTGLVNFNSVLGGISCPNGFANVTLEPGTTGKVTAFGVNSPIPTCTTSGVLANCKVKEGGTTSEGLPWVVHTNTATISITTVKMTIHLENADGEPCMPSSLTIGPGTVTATPDNKNSVSKVTLSGTLPSSLGFNVTVGGSLNAIPSGTYGI
jgi:hypothetical protein